MLRLIDSDTCTISQSDSELSAVEARSLASRGYAAVEDTSTDAGIIEEALSSPERMFPTSKC